MTKGKQKKETKENIENTQTSDKKNNILEYIDQQKQVFIDYMVENNILDKFKWHKDKIWGIVGQKINEVKNWDKETKALVVLSLCSFIASIIEILRWFLAWSASVISSALDSLLDCFLWLFSLFLLKQSQRSVDENYNYWYGKIQWLWWLLQWTIILTFWLSLVYYSITKIINVTEVHWIPFLMVLIAFDFWIALYTIIYFKQLFKDGTNNMILKWAITKAYQWLLLNWWIMIWLIIIYISKHVYNYPLYILDPLIGLWLAIYIIIWWWELLINWFNMLMDKSIWEEDLEKVKFILEWSKSKFIKYDSIHSRVSWNIKFIEFNLFFDQNITALDNAYTICLSIKEEIQTKIEDSIVKIYPVPYDIESTK